MFLGVQCYHLMPAINITIFHHHSSLGPFSPIIFHEKLNSGIKLQSINVFRFQSIKVFFVLNTVSYQLILIHSFISSQDINYNTILFLRIHLFHIPYSVSIYSGKNMCKIKYFNFSKLLNAFILYIPQQLVFFNMRFVYFLLNSSTFIFNKIFTHLAKVR